MTGTGEEGITLARRDDSRGCVTRIVSFGFKAWGCKTLPAQIEWITKPVFAVAHPASKHSDGLHPGAERTSSCRLEAAQPDLVPSN